VVVDARLPDSLFDLVENSGRRPSEKSEMEADMSSDDDEPKNEDNKKDKRTWTESLQDHLCVSEHEEAKDSLITISHHVIQIKGDEKVENSDCSDTVDNELSVPKWCACTDSELDAGFEDSCISDEEVVSICQQMGWQVAEIADLMFVLSEVKQSGWQGIEKEFLLNSSALQQKCQSSMPISNLAQTLLNFGVVYTFQRTVSSYHCFLVFVMCNRYIQWDLLHKDLFVMKVVSCGILKLSVRTQEKNVLEARRRTKHMINRRAQSLLLALTTGKQSTWYLHVHG
jgi:hypothetical protein